MGFVLGRSFHLTPGSSVLLSISICLFRCHALDGCLELEDGADVVGCNTILFVVAVRITVTVSRSCSLARTAARPVRHSNLLDLQPGGRGYLGSIWDCDMSEGIRIRMVRCLGILWITAISTFVVCVMGHRYFARAHEDTRFLGQLSQQRPHAQ